MVGSSLNGPVGQGAKNTPADVITVRKMLNASMAAPGKRLPETATVDNELIDAIKQFQKQNGVAVPDGKVDHMGLTAKHLKDPNKKFAWKPGTGTLGAVGGATKGALKYRAEMEAALKAKGVPQSKAMMYLQAWEEQQFGTLKPVLGMIGKADEARQFAQFFWTLEKWGFSGKEIIQVLVLMGSMKSEKFTKLVALTLQHGPKIEKIAKGAEKIGIFVTIVEVINKVEKSGDFAIVPAEIYKFAIGKGVPWAGIIDGTQSLIEGFLPDSAKGTAMFKLMRAVDPAGLGAVGVDAVTTLVYSGFEAVISRKTSADQFAPRLDRLVQRMRESPANFFVEQGETIGDAVWDIAQMSGEDWTTMMKWPVVELKNWANSPKSKAKAAPRPAAAGAAAAPILRSGPR